MTREMIWLAASMAIAAAVAQEPAPVPACEIPPVLAALDVLPPELARGPHHRVREMAPSDGYLTHFTIDSDFGVFECVGRRELEQRVAEVSAIAKLVEVSKSDLFAEGLRRSVTQPIDAVKNIVEEPVESVKAVPKTVGHFFSKVGSAVGDSAKRVGRRIEGAKSGEVDSGEALAQTGRGVGRAAKSVAGFDQAKLQTARQLGVDPYSDNPRLQEEMEKVTWAFFAGGMPLRVVGVVTGAGVVVAGAKGVGLPEEIYDVTPSELALRDRRALEAMGAEAKWIDALIGNAALSVSVRHAIVSRLAALPGAGRLEIARLAAACERPRQARFLAEALGMLMERHNAMPFTDVQVFGRLPAGLAADGGAEIAAPVDLVSWTEEVAAFAMRDDLPAKKRLLASGSLSPAAMAGVRAAGWEVVVAGE